MLLWLKFVRSLLPQHLSLQFLTKISSVSISDMYHCLPKSQLVSSSLPCFTKMYNKVLRNVNQWAPVMASVVIVIGAYVVFTSASSRMICEQQLKSVIREIKYSLRTEDYERDNAPCEQNSKSSGTEDREELFNYLMSTLQDTECPNVDNYVRYTIARLRLKPLKDAVAVVPEFGAVLNDVLSLDFSLNREECAPVNASRSFFIAIFSASANFANRRSVRETWLKQVETHANAAGIGIAGVRFVIAKPENESAKKQLEEESKRYRDVLQVDVSDVDSTLKEVSFMSWAHRYCSNVTYVIKLRDDVFVNTRLLAQTFAQTNDTGLFAYGRMGSRLKDGRSNKTSLNTFNNSSLKENSKKNQDEWPWKSYPTYLSGLITVMTSEAISATLAASQTIPLMLLEDVYITGLCARKAGVRLMTSDR